MNDPPPQPALRELQDRMTHPATLAALAGIGGILGLAGPFGTGETMRLLPRLAYWLGISFATYAAGLLAHILVWPRLPPAVPDWLCLVIAGLATGAAATLTVLTLNAAVFGRLPAELPAFVATIFAIAMIVTILLHLLEPHFGQATAGGATPPPILDRLPLDKRGALLALSVEDHYVRIRTTRGTHLVLLRLSDAIREVGDTPGLQVHRSHWVAHDAIAAARRDGDRAILTLHSGAEVPVSRARLPAVRDAGLLPR